MSRRRRKPPSSATRWVLGVGFVACVGLGGAAVVLAVGGSGQLSLRGLVDETTESLYAADRVASWTARVTPEEEQALGAKLERRLSRHVVKEAPLQRRVDAALARVIDTGRLHRPTIVYRAFLVDLSAPNAFAVAGGRLYLDRALVRSLDDDALGFLLGHEVSHVDLRHCADAAQTRDLARELLEPVGLGRLGAKSAGLLRSLVVRGYNDELEAAADLHGFELATAAGFDARGPERLMAHFGAIEDPKAAKGKRSTVQDLGRALREGRADWVQTHPATSERVAALRRLVQKRRSEGARKR